MHVEPGVHERDKTFAVVFGGISSLILLVAVATIIHFVGIESQPARLAPETDQQSKEVVFETPKKINWPGTIISITGGGTGYAVQLIEPEDGNSDFLAIWPNDSNLILSGRVVVSGYWTGITCAYRYTLFSGQCVPEIEIETIESF
ncbi:MAG: hypothetical protein AAB561_02005 [Patescibacteria group bacterium]